MKTIGITGGIGSGKSTVCDLLAARGACVFNADVEGRAALAEDPDVRRAVEERFGPQALGEDGAPDRAWLAERVFSSDTARADLEDIVHPVVARRFQAARTDALDRGCPVLVKEQAVFPKDPVRRAVDAWIVVEAPMEVRLDRVMARNGLTRGQARARMHAQPSADVYRTIADHVLVNSTGLDALERQVDEVWKSLGLS